MVLTGSGASDTLILSEIPSPDLPGSPLVLAINLPFTPNTVGQLNSAVDLDPNAPGNQELVIGQGTKPMITVDFTAGANTLELDSTWSYHHPLTMGGAGSDTLQSNSSIPSTWTLSSPNAGEIGSNTSFSGVSTIAGDNTDTLQGQDEVAATWSLSDTAPWSYTVNGSSLNFSRFATAQAGSGDNSFQVASHDSHRFGINLMGGAGDDSFSFYGTAQLGGNIDGGAGSNQFVFANAAVLTGSIDGIGGVNTLDLSAYSTDVTVQLTSGDLSGVSGTTSGSPDPISGTFANVKTLLGGSGSNSLIGENTDSYWYLSGWYNTYGGQRPFFNFNGFGSLTGGTADDTFTINAPSTASLHGGAGTNRFVFTKAAALTGSIDGIGGVNTLDLSAYTSDLIVALSSGATGGVSGITSGSPDPISGSFANIGTLLGSTASNSLIGDNSARTWNLNGAETYGDGSNTFLSFTGFNSLTGGSGDDTFNILANTTADLQAGAGTNDFIFANATVLTGSIAGQGGCNILDLSQVEGATNVDLATGTTSMVTGTLTNVQEVVTGSGNSSIVGDNSSNTFVSNGSADELVGGTGDNTYMLTLQRGSSTSVTDDQGNNTLDFSNATTGVTLNLDEPTIQTVAPDRELQIRSQFTTIVGTPFADQIDVTASALARAISGGPDGSSSGDVLQVDADGRVTIVTPTQVLVEGMAAITYSHFGKIVVIDQAQADLVTSQSIPVESAVLQENFTIVVTVTNQGPSNATQVVLTDALPATMTFVSATPSQGSLQVSQGILTANLGSLPVGAQATIQITLIPQVVGTSNNTASVTAHEPDSTSESATSSPTISTVQGTPPPVITLQVIDQALQGTRNQPKSIVLSFNAPLAPASAQKLSHYVLIVPGRDGKFGTRDDRRIRLTSARYNASTESVTLRPAVRLVLRHTYMIQVSGITGANGAILDGAGNGQPASLYPAIFQILNK